jgi:hypothetical protein
MQQTLALGQEVKNLSGGVQALDETLSSWPILPVGDESYAPFATPDHLSAYASVYDTYSSLLSCPGSQREYDKLKLLRESAQSLRKSVAELTRNKATVGAQAVLNESLKLKELLLELHRAENTFIGVVQQEFQCILVVLVGAMTALNIH